MAEYGRLTTEETSPPTSPIHRSRLDSGDEDWKVFSGNLRALRGLEGARKRTGHSAVPTEMRSSAEREDLSGDDGSYFEIESEAGIALDDEGENLARDRTRFAVVLKGGLQRASSHEVDDDNRGDIEKIMKDLYKAGFTWKCAMYKNKPNACLPHIPCGKRLLFNVILVVDLPEETLLEEHIRYKMDDWIRNGSLGSIPKDTVTLEDRAAIRLPTYKLELMYRMLSRPRSLGGAGIVTDAHKKSGYANDAVINVFPLHDDRANKRMMANWLSMLSANFLHYRTLRVLNMVRATYGDTVGFYFAFLDHYVKSSILIAVGGILVGLLYTFRISEGVYFRTVSIWGFVVSGLWAPAFLRFWKRRKNYLGYEWGVWNLKPVMYPNPRYMGRSSVNPITGEATRECPWWIRVVTRCISAVVMVLLVFVIFVVGVFFSDSYVWIKTWKGYNATEMWFLVLCHGILWALAIDVIVWSVFQPVSIFLNHLENHRYESGFDKSYKLKIFLFYFWGYFPYFLCVAFLYVPFGEWWAGWWFHRRITPYKFEYSKEILNLHGAFVTPMVVTQLLNLLLDAVVPWLGFAALRKIKNLPIGKQRREEHRARMHIARMNAAATTINNGEDESVLTSASIRPRKQISDKSIQSSRSLIARVTEASVEPILTPIEEDVIENEDGLQRIMQQCYQVPYDPTWDYARIVIQFGMVTMFSGVWSFIGLCVFVNNFLKLRSDLFKMATLHSRPIPVKAKDTGVWIYAFQFTMLFAMAVNSCLMCFSTGALEWFAGCPASKEEENGSFLRLMEPNWSCIDVKDRLLYMIITEHGFFVLYHVIRMSLPSIPGRVYRYIEMQDLSSKHQLASAIKQKLGELGSTASFSRGYLSEYLNHFDREWDTCSQQCRRGGRWSVRSSVLTQSHSYTDDLASLAQPEDE